MIERNRRISSFASGMGLIALVGLFLSGGIAYAQKGGGSTPPPNPEIAFSDAGIKVMNADGTNIRTVVAQGRNEFVTNPHWSPTGTALVFDGQFASTGVGVYTVNLDGTNRRKVTGTTAGNGSPQWSRHATPSGQRMIAFMDYGPLLPSEHNQVDVFLVNPDGTGRINLTNSQAWEWSCGWGADGNTLYVARDGNFYDLVKFTLGSNGAGGVVVVSEEVVWSFGNTIWQPSIANTSESIVFRLSGDPYSRIYEIGLNPTSTPDLVTLASGADETSPSFSPDDSTIVFWRGGSSGGIFTVKRDGSGEKRINAKGRAPSWKRPALPAP